MDLTRCFVLGAGSSACIQAPLLGNFLPRAQWVRDTAPFPNHSKAAFVKALGEWERMPKMDLESFFGLVDLKTRFPIADAADRSLPWAVQYLITKTLIACIEKGALDVHAAFVAKNIHPWNPTFLEEYGAVIRSIFLQKQPNVIISTNWDLALERVLDRSPAYAIDYGYQKVDRETPNPNALCTIPVLKIHGSLDWWMCENPECGYLHVAKDAARTLAIWESAIGQSGIPCARCKSSTKSVVVPPVAQKLDAAHHEGLLGTIWLRAFSELKRVNEIVIIGYSFPPTDIQFRTLLVDAIARNQNLIRITVVTDPKVGTEKAIFEDRVVAMLRPSGKEGLCRFDFAGFEGWS